MANTKQHSRCMNLNVGRDTRHQTPDTRHQTPDTRHQTPDTTATYCTYLEIFCDKYANRNMLS